MVTVSSLRIFRRCSLTSLGVGWNSPRETPWSKHSALPPLARGSALHHARTPGLRPPPPPKASAPAPDSPQVVFERTSPFTHAFRHQPPGAPCHRFFAARPADRPPGLNPGLDFALGLQAHRYARPNRVRHPTDCMFTSGCSPPHLAAAQLPLATRERASPGEGTFTPLVAPALRRTVPGRAGGLP